MESTNLPLVSVPVVTYNSSKYVIETLESIKAQTYQNIELIISDDCSTDNTVELCRNWIDENKDRFVRTELITSDINTGVSANGNRGREACRGEWIKGIAGDDLLLPNCIEICIDYVLKHSNTICLFSKVQSFGANVERNREVDNFFDYSFFSLGIEEQLNRLIFIGNCIPAITFFYNRIILNNLDIKNDERIPFLEDWPKWINLLKKEVKFHFIDIVLVKYRVGGISTTKTLQKPAIHRSNRMFYYLYLFQERYKTDPMKTILEVLNDEECKIYDSYYSLLHSKAYRLGKFLLKPFYKFKQLLNYIR